MARSYHIYLHDSLQIYKNLIHMCKYETSLSDVDPCSLSMNLRVNIGSSTLNIQEQVGQGGTCGRQGDEAE